MNHYHANQDTNLLSRFIDSIEVKLRTAECREISKPFYFKGSGNGSDMFVGLNKGTFFTGKEILPMEEGSFYFIPRGQKALAGTGMMPRETEDGDNSSFEEELVKEGLSNRLNSTEVETKTGNIISFVTFDTILYNAFPFFPLLDLPAFTIPANASISALLREICIEQEQNRLGREVILKNYTSELMVHLFRFINTRPGFDKIIEKLNYLTDVRLIDIVKYVNENMDKELTNAAIAKVACVSDEYVGQFFKSLTGRTLQDYIESQRMERALHLLRTIPNSVQEIALMVGFKDAAYFSRRFRMHFKMNANVLRQSKN